jgi:hypothetical protein
LVVCVAGIAERALCRFVVQHFHQPARTPVADGRIGALLGDWRHVCNASATFDVIGSQGAIDGKETADGV